jgi:hypothetical protein
MKAEYVLRENIKIAGNGTTQLTKADVGSLISTRGATGAVTVKLPLDAQPGDKFKFFVDAAQQTNVDPGTLNKIQFGATLSNAAQVLRSSTLGDHQTLVCATNPTGGPAIWRCEGAAGAWALV